MLRGMTAGAVALSLVSVGLARAEPTRIAKEQAKKLAAEGEAFGAKSQFQAALEKFKLAASFDPETPAYLCNIGLAHYAMNNFSRAHLYLARCHHKNDDVWPAGVEDVFHFVEDALAKADLAPVDITVTPAAANATVRISSLDDEGELPTPIRVYLAIDHHQIKVAADGYVTKREELLVASKTPMPVSYELTPAPAEIDRGRPLDDGGNRMIGRDLVGSTSIERPAPTSHRRRWGWVTTAAGGATLAAAFGLYLNAVHHCGADFGWFVETCETDPHLSADQNQQRIDESQTRRYLSIALASLGGLATGLGVYLVVTAGGEEYPVEVRSNGTGASVSVHF